MHPAGRAGGTNICGSIFWYGASNEGGLFNAISSAISGIFSKKFYFENKFKFASFFYKRFINENKIPESLTAAGQILI